MNGQIAPRNGGEVESHQLRKGFERREFDLQPQCREGKRVLVRDIAVKMTKVLLESLLRVRRALRERVCVCHVEYWLDCRIDEFLVRLLASP